MMPTCQGCQQRGVGCHQEVRRDFAETLRGPSCDYWGVLVEVAASLARSRVSAVSFTPFLWKANFHLPLLVRSRLASVCRARTTRAPMTMVAGSMRSVPDWAVSLLSVV